MKLKANRRKIKSTVISIGNEEIQNKRVPFLTIG